MQPELARRPKPFKGLGMEGMIATWYAKNTAKSLAQFRAHAERIAALVPPGASVLEVAPGPGYLAIELAKLGPFRISGLDISQSFVRIAAENARRAGVDVDFRQGDAAHLPFFDNSFDFVVCRAAFKNFGDPIGALCEMHRVLKPARMGLIIDLRSDISDVAIDETVEDMRLNRIDAFVTRSIFKHMLRKRAYSKEDFRRMLAATPFEHADMSEVSIGLEVFLAKR